MPKHYATPNHNSDRDHIRLTVPAAYGNLSSSDACRAYARDLIADTDADIEAYKEKLASQKLAVKILKWIGIAVVLLGVVFGAIFGVHEVLNMLQDIIQPSIALIIMCIMYIVGYIAMAALIALGMAEVLNYLFGDPYHRGRDLCEEYEVILGQLRLEQLEEHQRAAQYLAAADELDRRAREAERQQEAKELVGHSETHDGGQDDDDVQGGSPRFRLVQGGLG